MKIITFLAVIVVFTAMVTITAYAQNDPTKVQKNEQTNVQQDSNKPVNTICPVSKEEADPEVTYTYNGKTYALCCNSCLKKFKADPEKYISRLSDDGKSIKKQNQEK
jgi:YHS domain-containing protein